MRTNIFFTVTVMVLFSLSVQSQISLSYEAGFNVGMASFQTDYGERGDFQSGFSGNMGVATSASFYINFFGKSGLWNDRAEWISSHMKVKAEVSYMQAKLEHFGKYVETETSDAEELKAMHGTSSVINTGAILEYHFMDIYYYNVNRNQTLDPYIGIGALATFSKPTFEYDLGDYEANPSILLPPYQNAIYTDSETTGSLAFSVGTRIKATEKSDIVIDSRWQYFFSNKIDALDPEISANKFNDWAYSLTVGYVFYLN